MKKLNGLTVVEFNCRETVWRIYNKPDGFEIVDEIEPYEQRRDVDLFHECELYGKTGMPYEVCEVNPDTAPLKPYQGVMKQFSDIVCEGIKKGNAVLIPTGFCMYAPAIAGGIQRAVGKAKKIGVVWVDAHCDNRVAEAAEMTRFVGIPVSTMAGQTFESWRKEFCGLEEPVCGKNIVASDIRVIDEHCLKNMLDAEIVHLTTPDFKNEAVWKSAIDSLAERVDVIYLSVDMDILHNSFTPAYIKCVPGGHEVETVLRNVRNVMETNKVLAFSLFCADFDRYENGGETTYQNAMRIIGAALENWKALPLEQ